MEGSRTQYAWQVLRDVEEFIRCYRIDDPLGLPPGSDHFSVGPKTMMAFLVELLPTIRPCNLQQYDSSIRSQQSHMVQWQPGVNWHPVEQPVTPSLARDWHRRVQPTDRVRTIVWHSIMIHPTRDVAAMTDLRMRHILAAIRLIEGDIYQVAQDKFEYKSLMKIETSKLRERIVNERRQYGDQLLQDVTASWFHDVPVRPAIPRLPGQEGTNLRSPSASFVPHSLQNANGYTNPPLSEENRVKTPSIVKTETNENKEPASFGTSSLCCRICLETFEEIISQNKKVCSTVCGHVFCDDCTKRVFKDQHRCPTCRQELVPMIDVHPLFF